MIENLLPGRLISSLTVHRVTDDSKEQEQDLIAPETERDLPHLQSKTSPTVAGMTLRLKINRFIKEPKWKLHQRRVASSGLDGLQSLRYSTLPASTCHGCPRAIKHFHRREWWGERVGGKRGLGGSG